MPMIGKLVALGLLLTPQLAAAAPRSGQYGPLLLAVNGNTVSGVFSESRGDPASGPQFSCVFLLRGQIKGDTASIVSWYPGERQVIRGRLAFAGGGVRLSLAEDHGGCVMTTGSMVDKPFEESLDSPAPGWIGVALVGSRRAVVRRAPGVTPASKPYLVEGDAVAILERRDGWTRIAYPFAEKPLTGWIAARDLSAQAPPTGR